MFNFEAMSASSDNKDEKQKQEAILSVAEARHDDKAAEESDTVEQEASADEALSSDMTQEDVIGLAGRLVAQETEKREAAGQVSFEKMVADQRQMIREELLRNERVGSGQASVSGENIVFSQDKMSSRGGASEWILSKLERIPGGKKMFGALALVVGLSAISEQAAARGNNDDFGDRIERQATRGAEGEIGRVISDLIRAPRKIYDTEQRARAREQQQMEQQMRQEQRQAERRFQSQEQASEQYVKKVANEISAFKRSFDRVLVQKSRTADDRDGALLMAASDTIGDLEKYDNEYVARYGGNAYGLSVIAQEKLQDFVQNIKSGKYSGEKWVENPLEEVSLAKFNTERSGQ